MGTNYYVAKNFCDCCNRYDEEYHIGKDSYGWAFTFQGYKYDHLTSWKAWKEFLKDQIIMNEYGERMDYESFVDLVENWKSPNHINPSTGRKNQVHNDSGRNGKYPWFNPEYDWDDEDGYSFTSKEFS